MFKNIAAIVFLKYLLFKNTSKYKFIIFKRLFLTLTYQNNLKIYIKNKLKFKSLKPLIFPSKIWDVHNTLQKPVGLA
jgi:hypothetical protein